jgi:acetyl esterase/lipase
VSDVFSLVGRPADAVLRYGEGPSRLAELYRSAGAGAPVLFLHGGFWRSRYDRAHARPLAAALADAGHPVALAEYRRVGEPGGGWMGTFDDVAAVVAAAEGWLGGPFLLVGHSAGGHLAVWSQSVRPAPGVAGIVSLAGVLDVEGADADALSEGAVAELVGGDLPERRARIDPLRLPPPRVPTVVMHGEADAEVPIAYARRYASAHPSTRLVPTDDGHYEFIDPRSAAFRLLLAECARLGAGQR